MSPEEVGRMSAVVYWVGSGLVVGTVGAYFGVAWCLISLGLCLMGFAVVKTIAVRG